MKKRVCSMAMALAICLSLAPMSLAVNLSFSDVPSSAWYYDDVKSAVETGLINGKSPTIYAPEDNLTYAEAIKLAACINQRAATGMVSFEKGSPWYQVYVDYAKANGIISKDYNWNEKATRAGYMEIFASALPDKPGAGNVAPLTEKNTVEDGAIPDVPMSHPQATAIYKLYRAGVVMGSDSKYRCNPSNLIRRSEVAAVVTRMMNSDARLSATIKNEKKPVEVPIETLPELTITTQPKDVTTRVGIWTTFSVEVSGGKAPYTYIWQQDDGSGNWQDLSDYFTDYFKDTETNSVQIKVTSENINGGMIYRAYIKDANGASVTSDAVKILFLKPDRPSISRP